MSPPHDSLVQHLHVDHLEPPNPPVAAGWGGAPRPWSPAPQFRSGERAQTTGQQVVDTTADHTAEHGDGTLQAQQPPLAEATDQLETNGPIDRQQRGGRQAMQLGLGQALSGLHPQLLEQLPGLLPQQGEQNLGANGLVLQVIAVQMGDGAHHAGLNHPGGGDGRRQLQRQQGKAPHPAEETGPGIPTGLILNQLADHPAQADAAHPLDGVSLAAVLHDPAATFARPMHWRMLHRSQRALRSGDWKYLQVDAHEYLFNLADDERERANQAVRDPQRLADLRQQWLDWNAQFPPLPDDATVSLVSGPGDMPAR